MTTFRSSGLGAAAALALSSGAVAQDADGVLALLERAEPLIETESVDAAAPWRAAPTEEDPGLAAVDPYAAYFVWTRERFELTPDPETLTIEVSLIEERLGSSPEPQPSDDISVAWSYQVTIPIASIDAVSEVIEFDVQLVRPAQAAAFDDPYFHRRRDLDLIFEPSTFHEVIVSCADGDLCVTERGASVHLRHGGGSERMAFEDPFEDHSFLFARRDEAEALRAILLELLKVGR